MLDTHETISLRDDSRTEGASVCWSPGPVQLPLRARGGQLEKGSDMDTWTRLCVDVTDTGEVIGASWERHVDGLAVGIGMVPPRDWSSIAVAATDARHEVERIYGVQLILWP